MKDNIFQTEIGAIGTADYLKSKYGKDYIVVRELDYTYSICGVNYYLSISDRVQLIHCTNLALYGKWVKK